MAISYSSNYDETLPFSDVCFQIALNTNTEQNQTIPGNANNHYVAEFGYNDQSNVFIGKNTAAAVPPAGTTTSSQYVELRPKKRYVNGGDVLSFITPDSNAYLSVCLRAIP